jgi:hypothetical protein
MADEPKYKRLTRARPRSRFALVSTGKSSLWLGPDHLLCIDSSGFTESYKRFYFRDIQAFLVRKTDKYKYVSLGLGVFGVLLAIFGGVSGNSVARIVLFSFAGFFCLCMFLNLLLGPTTLCSIQTAVQTELLPSLARLRKARKVLNLVRPLITSAQGELAPDEIAARFRGTSDQLARPAPPVIDPALPASGEGSVAPNVPPRIES